jgi:serine/threonine protein kinase
MARELPYTRSPTSINTTSSISSSKEVFRLTQMTGTLRFMAPEVAMGLPYNEQCDVYSFALIVWEMLTCTRPYAKLETEKDFIKKVFEQGQRPKIPTANTTITTARHYPASVMKACQDLLQGGWDANLSSRWTIHQMQATLDSMCTRLDESFSSSSSTSSSLQQQQQPQEPHSSSCSRKQFGGRMMTVQRRRMTFSNKKTSLFLSWPKRFLLPSNNKQLHPKRGPQSGLSSTKREEESFVGEKSREEEEKEEKDNDVDDDDDYAFYARRSVRA